MLSWVFFRAEVWVTRYTSDALLTGIAGTRALLFDVGLYTLLVIAMGTAIVAWVDMRGKSGDRIECLLQQPIWFRWPAYYGLAIAILVFGAQARGAFIYFQF